MTSQTAYWAGILTFLTVLSFWSLNYIASEIERPFGEDMNDLPIADMLRDMNQSLSTLLMERAQRPPHMLPGELWAPRKFISCLEANYLEKTRRQVVGFTRRRMDRESKREVVRASSFGAQMTDEEARMSTDSGVQESRMSTDSHGPRESTMSTESTPNHTDPNASEVQDSPSLRFVQECVNSSLIVDADESCILSQLEKAEEGRVPWHEKPYEPGEPPGEAGSALDASTSSHERSAGDASRVSISQQLCTNLQCPVAPPVALGRRLREQQLSVELRSPSGNAGGSGSRRAPGQHENNV